MLDQPGGPAMSALLIAHAFLFSAFSVLADESPKKGEVRGKLEFKSRKVDFEGVDVGQEGNDRKYVAGHVDSPHRAIWNFDKFPKSFTTEDTVMVKLKCSHFKLTTQDGPGAVVVIRAVSHTCMQIAPTREEKGEWQWK